MVRLGLADVSSSDVFFLMKLSTKVIWGETSLGSQWELLRIQYKKLEDRD